mgnify:CR=1 FL=1
MTLLRKYYEADLPTGGGIPDEVIKMLEEKFRLPTEKELGDFESIEDAVSHMATQNLCFAMSKYGYSLAFEELARLKEENERLRGEDDPFSLHDVLKRLSGATKYLLDKKDYDGPDYEELEICVLRAKEIIRELETTPSPTKK